jgi:hypothetical protein
MMRTLAIGFYRDVTATAAPIAHGVGFAEVPNAALKAEVSVGQGANGTDVHHVA